MINPMEYVNSFNVPKYLCSKRPSQSVLLKDCLIIELTITEGLTMTVLKVLRSAKTWKGVIYCSKL